jgi:hypothetical protein
MLLSSQFHLLDLFGKQIDKIQLFSILIEVIATIFGNFIIF